MTGGIYRGKGALAVVSLLLLAAWGCCPPIADRAEISAQDAESLSTLDGWTASPIGSLSLDASLTRESDAVTGVDTVRVSYNIAVPGSIAGISLGHGGQPLLDLRTHGEVVVVVDLPTLACPGSAAVRGELKDVNGVVMAFSFEDNPLTPEREGVDAAPALLRMNYEEQALFSPFFDPAQVAQVNVVIVNPVGIDRIAGTVLGLLSANPVDLAFTALDLISPGENVSGILRVMTRGLLAE